MHLTCSPTVGTEVTEQLRGCCQLGLNHDCLFWHSPGGAGSTIRRKRWKSWDSLTERQRKRTITIILIKRIHKARNTQCNLSLPDALLTQSNDYPSPASSPTEVLSMMWHGIEHSLCLTSLGQPSGCFPPIFLWKLTLSQLNTGQFKKLEYFRWVSSKLQQSGKFLQLKELFCFTRTHSKNVDNYFLLKNTICFLEKKQVVVKFAVSASCKQQ